MNVRELSEWLQAFPDQDAIVEVLFHESGTGYYDQGGNCYRHQFSPTDDYFEYTDFRENKFVADEDPRKQVRILQLGTMNN